jgi:hypothetical protein
MLRERYTREDILAQVPEAARHTDPVLVQIDRLLDDDVVFQQVKADLARRYSKATQQGATPHRLAGGPALSSIPTPPLRTNPGAPRR